MTPLQSQVTERVAACIRQANQRLNKRMPLPSVLFNQRGKSAGSARLQRWELRFNPVLLAENPQAFLEEVVPHEVAHLVTFRLYGKVRPHGREWQQIMSAIYGLEPRATHSFDVSSVQGETFLYRCQCSDYPLTIRRHNKIQRGQTSYRCRQCGHPLIWANV